MVSKTLPDCVDVVATLDAASAQMMAFTSSGGMTVPGCAFFQGKRLFFQTAMGFQKARQFLHPEAFDRKRVTSKEVDPFNEVREHFNRALDPNHFNAIADYLMANPEIFVLPPLIVNANANATQVRLLCVGDPRKQAMCLGWLIYDDSFSPLITDGQHRQQGLSEATMRDHRTFASSCIGLMVSFEEDVDQIHQDFADCAKTKPIPTSLMQFYDRRAVSGRLVRILTDQCPLFMNGKVDPQAKSIVKGSITLYLHSQLVSFLKAIVLDLQSSSADFETHLVAANTAEFRSWLVGYVNDITDAIPPLREAAALGLTERDKIVTLRESAGLDATWIPFSAPGLRMLGVIGRELRSADAADYGIALKNMSKIDWRSTGPVWANNLSIARDPATQKILRIQTGNKFVKGAAAAVLAMVKPQAAAA